MTLDGINYSECEQPFTIYSNEIQISSVNPKCGSVTGGTEITLMINIDAETASSLCDLKVGFQPKKSAKKNEMSRQSIEQLGVMKEGSKMSAANSIRSSRRGSRDKQGIQNNQQFEEQTSQQR